MDAQQYITIHVPDAYGGGADGAVGIDYLDW